MASLENVKYDTSFILPECTFTPPQECKFAGWALSEDGNILCSDQAEVTNLAATPDAVIHLYAVWTEITNHNITYYNVPDGIVNENPETFNESDDITLATLTDRTGYTFDGWYDNAELSDEKVSSWAAGEKTDDVTLYAKWNAITYTVKFLNPNNDEELSTAQAFTYDVETKLNVFEITPPQGYKFTGWATSKSNEVTYTSGQCVKNLASEDGAVVTLYAVWIENEAHSITYTLNLNEGETVSNTNVNSFKETEKVTLATLTGRTGYTFAGWYDNAELSGDSISGWAAGEKTDDVKLYAKWNAITYTVKFLNPNNDEELSTAQAFTYDVETKLNVFEITPPQGYKFTGWATSKSNEVTYTSGQSVKNLASEDGAVVTLYAVWIENEAHSITYTLNLNAGETVSNTNVNSFKETQEVTLADLTGRTGYTFAGWYDNAELSGDSISGWDAGDKTDDVKLYAKWTLNEYTVTFNSMGGSTVNEQKVYYNQKITQPAPEPTREASGTMSYEFSGWYTSEDEGTTLSETAFNFDTPVTDNLTLYAKWTETITTVSISIELSVNTDKSDITVNPTSKGNLYTYTVQNADNYTDFAWEIDGSTPPEEWAGVSGGTLIINATELEPGWYDISLTAQDNSGKYYSFFGQIHVTKD